ncbi:hypothetical protein [Microbacterium lacticum]|uniref:hypothetical protein n=1 Tax=Microbacterium lacticum TaxID=33885 RepID=UPI0024304B8C|nr:hypothetical protein [Microbacterium lacticum]
MARRRIAEREWMPLIFLCGFVAIALWSLVEHRFERYGVAGPAALTLAGAVLVFIDVDGFAEAAAGDAAEHVVELILAVLLFVDACEVRGGVFGGEGRAVARLVLIALPLSLLAVVLSGVWMLPQLNVFVLLVIVCVVMPTDFSPAATLLRSPWIPLAFGTATVSTIAANGFVAAFVAGILYRLMRTRGTVEHTIPHTEVMLVEEVGTLAANLVWFVLGAMTVVVAALGFIGPRGTATIVFGLLAFAKLPEPEAYDVLAVMVFTVVGSIALHGVLAPQMVRRRMPRAESSAASTDHL